MKPLLCALAATGVWALSVFGVQAQVVRCTDAATGKVTYTDGSCQGGTVAREVEARKSPEEIRQERAQAAEALERKHQRLQAEAAAAAQAARQAPPPAAAATPDYARSPECTRSRRNLDVALSGSNAGTYEQGQRVDAAQRQVDLDCLGPKAYADLEKSRAARPLVVPPANTTIVLPPRAPHPVTPPAHPARPQFTQCNVFRCYDSQGNSYPR